MNSKLIGIILIVTVLLIIFVVATEAGIGEPGEGWKATCDGEVNLLKSTYWGEVLVECDMPEHNIFSKSKDWRRGCYNLVHTWRVFPGEFHIVCEEDGIP